MRKSWILIALVLVIGCNARAKSPASIAGANYRVQPGESLFSIADRAYGNGLEWPRIWEANPWIDPDRLRPGETLYIPRRDASWGDPPSQEAYALRQEGKGTGGRPTTKSSNPGGSGIEMVVQNLATEVSRKTLFGLPLQRVLLILFACFLAHAIFQGVLMWLAANLTFVKDASLKKSMKVVFMTESLTFSTLVVLAGVAIVMMHAGTEPAGGASGAPLFPELERLLRSPTGIGVACAIVMTLYVILSLRFIPQVFGVPMSRAMTLMALSILIPHLAGLYLVGQRTGLIH